MRYFAAAADAAGIEEERWPLPADATIAALREGLTAKYGEPMARVLRAGSFLVNGVVRRDDGPIGGSEAQSPRVDVLPPFAGG